MKILVKILDFYEIFCQNIGLLQKISQKTSILTRNYIEVQYFDKYFYKSPVFLDLEFLQKSSIFLQNSKSKIPIVDNQPVTATLLPQLCYAVGYPHAHLCTMLHYGQCMHRASKANDIDSSFCLIDWDLYFCLQKDKGSTILLFKKVLE